MNMSDYNTVRNILAKATKIDFAVFPFCMETVLHPSYLYLIYGISAAQSTDMARLVALATLV